MLTVMVTDMHEVVPQLPPSERTKYVVVVVGETVSDAPLPTEVPVPQPPAYHLHVPPVNNVPCTLNVVLAPEQMEVAEAVTPVGPQMEPVMVTVTDAHVVVLQVPSARTK